MTHCKKTTGDRIFDFFIYLFVAIIIIVTLYPLIYTFSMSISDPTEAARGHVWLLPKGFNLAAVRTVLSDSDLITYYYNTFWFTIVGTVLGIITTSLCAYPLSRPEFGKRSLIMKFVLITMFFSGGLIPTYIVVAKFLGLFNSRWAIILPGLTTAWYVVVARSFFEGLPGEIVESARIDGASEYRIFAQLIMPLSKPVLAVLALYFAVGYWNGYFNAMLYLGKKELQPLAMYVRSVVIQSSVSALADAAVDIDATTLLSTLQIKYAVIVISVLPMLCVYPFLSKNLEKGLMIGSVKG
ncbi:MAG: carbohydrate ABC transporter permease [Clostridia bacterium]|nr:carbohydrate ABC transporter permease [Clostridia bacterium]